MYSYTCKYVSDCVDLITLKGQFHEMRMRLVESWKHSGSFFKFEIQDGVHNGDERSNGRSNTVLDANLDFQIIK